MQDANVRVWVTESNGVRVTRNKNGFPHVSVATSLNRTLKLRERQKKYGSENSSLTCTFRSQPLNQPFAFLGHPILNWLAFVECSLVDHSNYVVSGSRVCLSLEN